MDVQRRASTLDSTDLELFPVRVPSQARGTSCSQWNVDDLIPLIPFNSSSFHSRL